MKTGSRMRGLFHSIKSVMCCFSVKQQAVRNVREEGLDRETNMYFSSVPNGRTAENNSHSANRMGIAHSHFHDEVSLDPCK